MVMAICQAIQTSKRWIWCCKKNAFEEMDSTCTSTMSLMDELLAVDSIFGDAIEVHRPTATSPARVTALFPWGTREVITTFTYTQGSTGVVWEVDCEGFPRGTVTTVLKRLAAIQETYTDAPVLFLLLEELRAAVDELSALSNDVASGAPPASALIPAPCGPIRPSTPLAIFHGPDVVQQKSTFQAHVAQIRSREDVTNVIAQLYGDSRIARATHNMYAYRIVRHNEGGAVVIADNDDDGEDAAGSRLAHLLDLMNADNLLVVVSRWFGGVLMGPSRFKAICEVARDAIEGGAKEAGWYTGRIAPGVTSSNNRK